MCVKEDTRLRARLGGRGVEGFVCARGGRRRERNKASACMTQAQGEWRERNARKSSVHGGVCMGSLCEISWRTRRIFRTIPLARRTGHGCVAQGARIVRIEGAGVAMGRLWRWGILAAEGTACAILPDVQSTAWLLVKIAGVHCSSRLS